MRGAKKIFSKSKRLSNGRFRHFENVLSNLHLQKEHIDEAIKKVELKLHFHHITVLEDELDKHCND